MASLQTSASSGSLSRPNVAAREQYARRMHRRQQLRRGLVVIFLVAAVTLAYVVAGPWILQMRAAWTLSAAGLRADWYAGDDWLSPGSSSVVCSGNHWLDQTHDQELKLLPTLPHLESLQLVECHVSEPSLAVLSQLTGLEDLNLSRTHHYRYAYGVEPLDDRVLPHIRGLTRLRRLSLAGNRITDEGLKQLSGLTKLEDLDLEATDVTDECLSTLKLLTRLTSVSLSATRVTPEGAAKIRSALPMVEIVTDGSPELAASVMMRRGREP